MKQISITSIPGFRIGSAENRAAGTGCTVILCPDGMCAGVDVRGGGPASRDTQILNPVATADTIHAVLLGGGSAFGLDAAGGVQKYLEERGIGLEVGVTKVPLVCQSDIFDLTLGDPFTRPDAAMGYAACSAAEEGNYRDGCFGVGTGATVGKLCGMERCMKSGVGSFAVQVGELMVGAVVAVNALGDIYDWKTGKQTAGLLTPDRKGLASSEAVLFGDYTVNENRFAGNTTIGAILTNGKFDKSRLCKIAAMAQNGLARSIRPVHTSADGDSVYALSHGTVAADVDMVGSLAANVMAEAILCAVRAAEGGYGFPAARDIINS